MKKGYIVLAVLMMVMSTQRVFCQWDDVDHHIQLPIEEKLKLYLDIFRGGSNYRHPSLWAGAIALEFNVEVIPYLREYIQDADYFHYTTEPIDKTLSSIAYIMMCLHRNTHPVYADIIEPYEMDRVVVQWFVDQYKCKIDEYIRVTKTIDRVVTAADGEIRMVAGYSLNYSGGKWVGGNEIEKYGHPDFLHGTGHIQVDEVKEYYEKRLGISDLKVTAPQY